MLMFEYFVSNNVSCVSLNLQGTCMSHHTYCMSVFWMLISITLSESTGWPTHFVTDAARDIRLGWAGLNVILVDSCVSMMFVANDAFLWKADTTTLHLLHERDSFILILRTWLTSSIIYTHTDINNMYKNISSTGSPQFIYTWILIP